jgi:ATP-dependent Zn protease
VTTGSASDLKKATSIAERMVKTFGMSDRVGLRDFNASTSETEMGAFGRGQRTNDEIDDEIKRLLHESYERAREILTKYKVPIFVRK